ncbi:MAG TPA: hypothetical protein VKZ53_08975 [Candidatus Angelobacter sp.]|nr:hypothetical protein [Candidatus Angelobacter sp.]
MAAERYLLDEMPAIERHEFEDHYFNCPLCAQYLLAAADFMRLLHMYMNQN